MSLQSYPDLQAAVLDWVHRSDTAFTTRVPDFIRLAEMRLNRDLKLTNNNIEVSLTSTPGSRFIAFPLDCNTPIDVWLNYYQPRKELSQCIPKQLPVNTIVASQPQYWAADGLNIAFEMATDQAYPFVLRYQQQLNLSNSITTNNILSAWPDAYLSATLAEVALWTKDDAELQRWEAKYRDAKQGIMDNQSENVKNAPLRTELPYTVRGNRFNVYRGY